MYKKETTISFIEVNPVENKKEVAILDAILKLEGSHKQWLKHLLCFSALGTQVVVNLIRGSRNSPSILTFLGIQFGKCTWYDYTICVAFVMVCIMVTIIAIRRNNYE
jgi:hypothetical protein